MGAPASDQPADTALGEVLGEARRGGFVGPGPLKTHLAHAEGFAEVARGLSAALGAPPRLVDLGSGGGLPGLVVAARWREVSLTLVEANGRRAAFLRRAVERLGLGDAVSVLEARAETCGRQEGLRGAFGAVLARSFGRPAVTAECAAPLLEVGGFLVVSEPPRSGGAEAPGGRWKASALELLGLDALGVVRCGFDYMTLRQVRLCPERFPRRDGVPAKRPLF